MDSLRDRIIDTIYRLHDEAGLRELHRVNAIGGTEQEALDGMARVQRKAAGITADAILKLIEPRGEPTPKDFEANAQKMYSIWSGNHPTIHCNRMATWNELGDDERHQWRTLSAKMLKNEPQPKPRGESELRELQERRDQVDKLQQYLDEINVALGGLGITFQEDRLKAIARQALATPKKVRESDKVQYLIWSGEHNAYWRPDGAGYSTRLRDAGRYSLEDARKRTSHCGPEKQIEIEPIAALKSALASRDEWRPIEIAPREGNVLLFGPDRGIEVGFFSVTHTREESWFTIANMPFPAHRQPTHWQPLPTPPTNQERKS